MVDGAIGQPGSLLGPPRSVRLRLVRAPKVTLGTDPSLAELYRARYEGTPPKVRERGGVVTIEYGPRFRPGDWSRQATDISLNPSVGWRIEATRGMVGLRADLQGACRLRLGADPGPAGRPGAAVVPRRGQGGHHPPAGRHGGQGPGDRGLQRADLRRSDLQGSGRPGRLEDLRLRRGG